MIMCMTMAVIKMMIAMILKTVMMLVGQVVVGEKEKYTVYKLKLSAPGSVRTSFLVSPHLH